MKGLNSFSRVKSFDARRTFDKIHPIFKHQTNGFVASRYGVFNMRLTRPRKDDTVLSYLRDEYFGHFGHIRERRNVLGIAVRYNVMALWLVALGKSAHVHRWPVVDVRSLLASVWPKMQLALVIIKQTIRHNWHCDM